MSAALIVGLASCESVTGPDPFLNCSQVASIYPGETLDGLLSNSDCELDDGSSVDFYRFTLSSTTTVLITMRSFTIDSYLLLFEGDETFLELDDDSGGDLDAQIAVTLPAGEYVIAANAFDAGETGAYTLSLIY